MTHRIIQIHLSGYRYFAILTLPPLLLAFHLLYSCASVILLVLFFITHYYCWRLWLDERLFRLLNDDHDLAAFDNGMAQLWPKKSVPPRALVQRWRGVRRLFYRAILTLMALWLASLAAILYRALT